MDKLKTHFTNNAVIYLILFVCIVIVSISLFSTKEPTNPESIVDTKFLEVVTIEEALELFEDKDPKLLIISVNYCSATKEYVDTLKINQSKYNYPTYYLELTDIDTEKKEFTEFLNKLDMEYNFMGEIDKFNKFVGSTPMTVIIKNRKMVYGYIGNINTTTLKTLTDTYGVSNNEKN